MGGGSDTFLCLRFPDYPQRKSTLRHYLQTVLEHRHLRRLLSCELILIYTCYPYLHLRYHNMLMGFSREERLIGILLIRYEFQPVCTMDGPNTI